MASLSTSATNVDPSDQIKLTVGTETTRITPLGIIGSTVQFAMLFMIALAVLFLLSRDRAGGRFRRGNRGLTANGSIEVLADSVTWPHLMPKSLRQKTV